MRFLTLLRLPPIKVADHLLPLLECEHVEAVRVVRHAPVEFLTSPKVIQVAFSEPLAGYPLGMSALRSALNSFNVLWTGYREARRHPDEVIYGIYLIPYGLYALLIARLTGKKALVSLIGTDLNKDVLEYPWRGFWRWVLRRMDVITVFDEAARQKLLALGFPAERVYELPHAIDIGHYTRREDSPQDIDAVFVGSFWALKEVGRLLDSWARVVAARPGAKLALVGDGPLREKLLRQTEALGIQDAVIFAGWTDDVPAWLSRAKLFINLANQEGVPMAMLEAMACGLVPIATAVGGVPSVIREGENGYLVENPADPAIVAARVLRLLDDPDLHARLQAKALEVRQHHSYEAVSAWWLPILAQLSQG